MASSNFPITQRSNWSISQPVGYQQQLTSDTTNQNTIASSNEQPIDDMQNHWNNTPTQSESYISSVLPGLIIGILAGCVIFAVILSLWLTSSANKTTTTTTTGITTFQTSTILNTTTTSSTTTTSVTTSTTSTSTTTSTATTSTSTTTAGANVTYTYNENDAVNLTCLYSMRLTIVYAFYGVPSCDSNCNCGFCVCGNMTVTSKAITLCTGLISCAFSAADIIFGDACVGIGKTFIITLFCS